MKQEDLAFYGIYAQRLDEIHDMLLSEIQAILDGISTDSEKAPAEHKMPGQGRGEPKGKAAPQKFARNARKRLA